MVSNLRSEERLTFLYVILKKTEQIFRNFAEVHVSMLIALLLTFSDAAFAGRIAVSADAQGVARQALRIHLGIPKRSEDVRILLTYSNDSLCGNISPFVRPGFIHAEVIGRTDAGKAFEGTYEIPASDPENFDAKSIANEFQKVLSDGTCTETYYE